MYCYIKPNGIFCSYVWQLLRFSKTHELRGSKVNKRLCSTCMLLSIILLADLNRTSSKGHDLWFLIAGFHSVLTFSVFQGSFLVSTIMIDGRKSLKFRVHVLLKSVPVNHTTSPHKEAVYQELEANSILEPAMNVKKQFFTFSQSCK